MNTIPTITLELDVAEQDLLLWAIARADAEPDISEQEREQLEMLHNLIIQQRVEQDPDWEPAL